MEGQDWAGYQASDQSTSGIDFVAIKATEGHTFINNKVNKQAAHARTTGLQVDFYHFLRDGDMKQQAAFFVQHAPSIDGDGLWADWEDPNVSNEEKDEFIHEVKRLRPTHKVGLYANLAYWFHHDHTSYCGDMLWIADPSAPKGHPRIQHEWLYHQYGSPGGLDRNYCKMKTRADLKTFMRSAMPLKPPVKTPAPAKPAPVHAKPKAPAFPGASRFRLGHSDPAVTVLGKQLVKKGFTHHNDGHHGYNPGPRFTKYDQANLRDFQLAHKELKGDADGYPGPLTWKMLFS